MLNIGLSKYLLNLLHQMSCLITQTHTMSRCLEDRGGATFGDGTNPSPLAVGRQPPWRAICLGNCPSIWVAGVATYDVSDYSQILSTHLYQENDGCVFWTMRYQVPYLQASVEWRIRNTCELNSLLLFSPGGCTLCPCSHTHKLPEGTCWALQESNPCSDWQKTIL